jgi:hypothetical protein
MGAPSSPLALSPANLAVLQQRQPSAPQRQAADNAAPDAARAAPAPGSGGRGRFIDILA